LKSKIWNKDFGTVELTCDKSGKFDSLLIDQQYQDTVKFDSLTDLKELYELIRVILGEFGELDLDIDGQEYK